MTVKRTYNIPLRSEFQKVPYYKRSKKAITAIFNFLEKHMKSDNVKLGKHLNEKIWANGIRNPPHHVEVVVVKDDEGLVKAELVGFESEIEPKAKETKKEVKAPKAKESKEEKPAKKEDLETVAEKAAEKETPKKEE